MPTVAEAFVTLRPDLSKFGSEVSGALGKMGPQFQQAGTMLTAGLSLPLIGLGAIASKASVDFESAFAGVRKTVDATDSQLAELRKGIRDMAKELPASAGEISKVAEAAGQLGIKTENILGFTKVMVDLGETTNLTADQAATAMARIANIMQLPQTEFDRLGATLVDLGNKGASTEAEILEMATRIAGAGNIVGLSADEVLAFGNALSSVGIEAEAGGSAISRAFIEIANAVSGGGEELDGFAKVAGMAAADFSKAFKDDAAGAMITFIEGLGRMHAEGANVFQVLDDMGLGEIRVRNAMLAAAGAGDLFRQSLADGKQAWQENTALTVEAAKRYETTASKLETLRNKLNDVAITLGDALVPVLLKAVDAAEPLLGVITKMAEVFAKLPAPVQTGIVAMVGLAAIIGPLLLVVGAMATGFGALIAIAPLVGAAFTLMLGPVGLIIVALAALALGIFLAIKHWDEIKAAVSSAVTAIKDAVVGAFNAVLDFVKGNWREIATLISGPFLPIVALATDAFGIRSALEKALGGLKDKVGRDAGEIAKALSDAFTGATSFAGDLAQNIAGAVGSAFTSAVQAAKDGAVSVINAIAENFTAENIGRVFGFFLFLPMRLSRIFQEANEAVAQVVTQFFGQTLPNFFNETIPALAASAQALGTAIATGIGNGIASAATATLTFLTVSLPAAISAAASSTAAAATALGTSIANGIASGVSSAFATVSTFLTVTLPGAISGAAAAVSAAAVALGAGMIRAISDGYMSAIGLISAAPGVIKDAFVSAFNASAGAFVEIGRQIVQGIWNGIKSLSGWLYDQVKSFVGGLVNAAKSAAGEKSPSTEGIWIGKMFVRGVEIGLSGLADIDVAGPLTRVMGAARNVASQPFATGFAAPSLPSRGTAPRDGASTGMGLVGSGGSSGTSGGVVFQNYGPLNVQNIGDERDTEQQLGDLAFGMAAQLRYRGASL